jgi:uncharacterized repeat protein (TIGR02543 family)
MMKKTTNTAVCAAIALAFAPWMARGATFLNNEGFEGNAIPSGWSQTTTGTGVWEFGSAGDVNAGTSPGCHGGSRNAKCVSATNGDSTKLITPVLDPSGSTSPVLAFWFINRNGNGNIDGLKVYYRSNGSAWVQLKSISDAHEKWTECVLELPSPTSTYQIAFEHKYLNGRGVGLDDVSVIPWKYNVVGGGAVLAPNAFPQTFAGPVTIPPTLGGYPVTGIGDNAFYNCEGMTSVAIPDTVTSIGQFAFAWCKGLASIAIPDSVTGIGAGAFAYCRGLGAFSVGAGNPSYSSVDGLLLSKDGRTLVAGVNGDVVIPGTVISIDHHAFSKRTGLTSVVIPRSVKSIGNYAFFNCEGLTSLTIPDSVTSIGNSAFYMCDGLTSVTIPRAVTSIGPSAFSFCSGLTSVTIPRSVASIGNNAFDHTPLATVYVSVDDAERVSAMLAASGFDVSGVTFLELPSYTVKFSANGGTGAMADQKVGRDESTALRANAFTKRGCIFLGWSTAPIGAVVYADKASVKNLAAAGRTATLYAQWAVARYKVKFSPNGGTLPSGRKMAAQTMTYGMAAKLRKNVFTRKGYVFAGWARSKANAKKGVIAFTNAQSVKNLRADGKTTTFYAVWAKPTYKVAFYGNAKKAKGTMAVQTFKYGKAAKLSANKFKRKGYVFKGWAKSKKGKVVYKNKQKIKNLVITGKTVKLYAVWKKK